jgi:hypothetical protein
LDNQQERLAYLAGIIDGEGWIGLSRVQQKDGFNYRPMIAVHMVGKEWIDHVDDVARRSGLPSYVAHLSRSSRWSVAGMKRCEKVLAAVRPYLFVKAKQADIVSEFIVERMKRPYSSSTPTALELLLVESIQSLNLKGKNPQRLYAQSLKG